MKLPVLVYLQLAILLVMANPIDRDYCLKRAPNMVECDWYRDCLERLFECGQHGYPIGYGHKYCSKFKTTYFPDVAIPWVNKTLLCLKQALLPTI